MDNWEAFLTLGVVAAIIPAITLRRFHIAPEWALSGGLTGLIVAGVVDPAAAVAGFANPGLLTVAALFIVADGLTQTGSFNFLAQQVLGRPASIRVAQLRTTIPSGLFSAFLNNTPVVALMMPVVIDWAKKNRLSVSHLLLPLSYASILGGLCTLMGTSTTLVLNAKLDPQDQLGMFEIAQVGIPAAIVGIAWLAFATQWLIPERKPAFTALDDPREYTMEMVLEAGSPLVGRTIEEAGLRHLPGAYLMEIDRRGTIMPAVASDTRLEANDQLVFVGVVESVVDLQKIPGLKPATEELFQLGSERSERCLVEAVVSNSCPWLRMSIREARFRTNYNAAVIAVARDGIRIRRKIGDIELCAGDTLLLECHPSFIEQQRNSRHFFLVSQVEGSTPPRHERAWVARTILAVTVLAVAFRGYTGVDMLAASWAASGLMLITGCCRGSSAHRSIDLSVLIIMGAGLGIGQAMESSGAAALLAARLTAVSGNETVMLAVIYAVTMILANLITAKAAAVLVLPIAMATAVTLEVNHMPFVIAVMVAAAASFATPIGYQTNLMVQGPGGYRSSDYLRLGGPLSLLLMLVTLIVAPQAWPF